MVKEIHDFHLWALGDGKPIFTAHVVCTGKADYALYTITRMLQQDFKIYHATIQVEPAKQSSKSDQLLGCVNEFLSSSERESSSKNGPTESQSFE